MSAPPNLQPPAQRRQPPDTERVQMLARFALENASDAIYWVGPDSSILYVNPAACRMLGYSSEELTGMAIRDLNPDMDATAWEQHWQQLKSEGTVSLESTHRARDGRTVPVEIHANYLSVSGDEYNCAIVRDITDREETRKALAAANTDLERRFEARTAELLDRTHELERIVGQYQRVIKTTSDGFWVIDADTLRIVEANTAAAQMLGYPQDALLDMRIPDFDVAHSPEELKRLIAQINSKGQEVFETRLRTRTGTDLHIEISTTYDPVSQTYVAFLRDITARKQAEIQLIESEIRFRAIFEQAAVGIAYVDHTGRFLRVNRKLSEILGYPVDELVGVRFQDITHPDDLASSVESLRAIVAGTVQHFSLEKRYLRKNGEFIWADLTVSMFRLRSGDPVHQIVVIQDISERKRMEQNVLALNATLEQRIEERTAELTAANEAKSQFLANMSHEIRTPLNTIAMCAYLLSKDSLSQEQHESVQMIEKAGKSLLTIVDEILDFSKIEAGKITLDSISFSPAELMQSVQAMQTKAALEKGLSLVCPPHPELDICVSGDVHRLEQVLTNLVGNAIKFTQTGRIQLQASLVAGTERRVSIRFEVNDTGIGIPQDIQPMLFSPFTQADSSTTRRFGGTGLGLSICKRLVEMMGGQIGVVSTPGLGSTFWFEVPFQREKTAAVAPATGLLSDTPPPRRLNGLRILIADDDVANQEGLKRALRLEGAESMLVSNGQQVVDALRQQPGICDVILMDVQMPVMDGLTATALIRRELQLTQLPIIAVTAGILPDQRQKAMASGIQHLLSKPVDIDELIGVIITHTERNPPKPDASA